MDEHRQASRVRSFLKGDILFGNGANRAECTVRDISDTGARLAVSGTITFPEIFDLHIPQRQRTDRVRIIWQRGGEIGVLFVNRTPAPAPRPELPDMHIRVLELETEIGRLRVQLGELREKVDALAEAQRAAG